MNALYHRLKNRYDCFEDDPLYVLAKKNNDRHLILRLKDMYYGLTKDEENEMTQITGTRYIRRINENNNNYSDVYYVDLKIEDYQIIKNSGYQQSFDFNFSLVIGSRIYCFYCKEKRFTAEQPPLGEKALTFEEFLKLI